jgi:GTP-binding protein
MKRDNLVCLFVLLDSRLKPQRSDISFMEYLGINQVPFVRVFTKSDKVGPAVLKDSVNRYNAEMLKKWESLPVTFITSSKNKEGRDEILGFIQENLNKLSNRV